VLAADLDLLNPPAEFEKRKHKLKRLVQSPNSFFMDVKCQACARRSLAAAAPAAGVLPAPRLPPRAHARLSRPRRASEARAVR
jgi:hypothetical protein